MRSTIRLASIATLIIFAACSGDRVPTGGDDAALPKPLFDHVPPPTPTVAVDVNQYVLQLRPDHLGASTYKGAPTLYAGGLSYGNAFDAVFGYNPSGFPHPSLEGAALPVEVVPSSSFADHHTVSLLVEVPNQSLGPSVPIGLVVVRETYAFADQANEDYVILKYTLLNPRQTDVTNLHVGQMLDTDLDADAGGAQTIFDNVVEYDAVADLARVFPSLADGTPAVGHAMLREPTTSYRGFRNPGPSGPFGPHTDPQTNADYFALLSGGIVDPGLFGPADIRHVLTHGPVMIRGGEAEVFAFVLAGGDDADDLAANVAAARAKYLALPHSARQPHPVVVADVAIEPSPLDLDHAAEFTAVLQGIPRRLIPLVDATHTFCGARRAFSLSPATGLIQFANGIRLTFPIDNLSADRRHFQSGDEILCGGRLTDGTLFTGRVTPSVVASPPPVAPATRLTSIGTNRAPTWSPDGSSIAFASDRSGTFAIWRMSVAGGEASAVQLTSGLDHAPDWFGSTIVFSRGGAVNVSAGEIYAVPDVGGAVTLINPDGANPRYSPDGITIAFTRIGPPSEYHVWTMTAAGGGAAQITSGDFEFHPEWSPDGSEIYFTDGSAGIGAIFKVAASGGSGSRVTPDEGTDNRHPALSPDGRWLAFTSTRDPAEIVLQDLQTGHHTIVPLDPAVAADPVTQAERNQNLEFSPDGTKLLFAAGGHIWVADLSAVIP